MAKYGIFEKDHKYLGFIAESETERDHILFFNNTFIAVEMTDDQFNKAGFQEKVYTIDNSNAIVESDFDTGFSVCDDLAGVKSDAEGKIEIWTRQIDNYIVKKEATDVSTWETFKTKLNEVDIDNAGLSFPTGKSFMKWFSEQSGVPAKKALQIPVL